MKSRSPMLTVAILACIVGGTISPPRARAAHVSRCVDDNGSESYTDGSCRALGAQAVPMSAQLLHDLLHAGGMDEEALPSVPLPADNAIQARLAHPRVAGCSHTPAELVAALRGSLGTGDVNQLATAYDWTGVSATAAKPMMQKLERMSQSPLTGGHFFNANDGVVQLVQGTSTISEYSITRRAGCLFLQF